LRKRKSLHKEEKRKNKKKFLQAVRD
jgi:hypothetical protein